jgi:NitT/TauT family transport system substrate-binding protein/putative hydroxymethylpyrimidine transport system substrate-binding protein
MRPRYRILAPLLPLLGAVALAACGGDSGPDGATGAVGSGSRHATLVLDFVPGPVHAGIYEALAKGYYGDEGIDLEIVEPTSTADTLKLIDAGKADFGIADGIDLATQIAAGRGAQGILAIAQRPLGGLITLTESGVASPAELEGRTVGVTGVPSDAAILDTIVAADGGDPATVDTVTIGFNGVANLENGNVDAITGFIPADGVQAEIDGYPTTSFAPDRFGGLVYPGLVAFSTRDQIAADPALMQGFVSATMSGYEDVIADPRSGLTALLAANPAIPGRFARASLQAYLPSFTNAAGRFGAFDGADLKRLSAFMVDNGLADAPIDPARYATNEFVDGGG